MPTLPATNSRNLLPISLAEETQEALLKQIREISHGQIEEMKGIASGLNTSFRQQMQQEKELRLNEFRKFKNGQNSGPQGGRKPSAAQGNGP